MCGADFKARSELGLSQAARPVQTGEGSKVLPTQMGARFKRIFAQYIYPRIEVGFIA